MIRAGEWAVRQRGQELVEQHAASHIEALPDSMPERVEERDGGGQMGTEMVEHEIALGEGFAHQGESPLLQIAKPAVEELAGATRCPSAPPAPRTVLVWLRRGQPRIR
jgi:hypothetical protein